MRLPSTRFLGNALPTTISAGAVALLLLSFPVRPVVAQSGAEPVGYLETRLLQHDLRYALQLDETCTGAASEFPIGTTFEVAVDEPVAQERAR